MQSKFLNPALNRRAALLGSLCATAFGSFGNRAAAQAPAQDDPWPSLAAQIFNDRRLQDGAGVIAVEAPYRAEDAAVVPVTMRSLLPAGDPRRIRAVTLVIDQNPSPLAATMTPGGAFRSLATRVRVDSYTNMHVVAELDDGTLHAAARFVKAAGGCSAPASRQVADAIPLGTMRFRQFPPDPAAGAGWRQAQLMIRHPNYSGMQMDQLTRLYVPAHFVTSVRIWQGEDALLAIESGISISENPEFRFDYRPNGARMFRAEATDSEGKRFHGEWPAPGES
jgi:sulfur-oxidizing protein SoxY